MVAASTLFANFPAIGNQYTRNQRPLPAQPLIPGNTTDNHYSVIPYVGLDSTRDSVSHLYSSIPDTLAPATVILEDVVSSPAPQGALNNATETQEDDPYSLPGPDDDSQSTLYAEPTDEESCNYQVTV